MTHETAFVDQKTQPEELLRHYKNQGFFDEVVNADGQVRPEYEMLIKHLSLIGTDRLDKYQDLKDKLFHSRDVTFNVYGDSAGVDRTFPLDLIPRIIEADKWQEIEQGLAQRLKAINLFLGDVYSNGAQIAKDDVIPMDFITSCHGYDPRAIGLPQPMNARALVAGIDLVRNDKGEYLVLEDNLRVPSGVSYVLENRAAMTKLLPNLMEANNVRPVEQYPTLLLRALQSVTPKSTKGIPTVVLLTPGIYNSAYFEHAFLAQNMGIELVEGRDLFVDNDFVWMKTTRGPKKVDVIYRRIDDDFMDPTEFNRNSMLGVPGIIDVMRKQNVSVANALGNGAADDKAMYVYVPEMIRYYLGEKPILSNVTTYLMMNKDQCKTVMDDPTRYVIKTVDGSGGYDIFIGPQADDKEVSEIRKAVAKDPSRYIAQEVIKLSRHPSIVDGKFEPRHVDLRPFVVGGEYIDVLPGGLTRVALKKGSLIVNSSQGGGSKDTWILQKPGKTYSDTSRPMDVCGEPRSDKILARASEPLFWAGRYLERVDTTARLLSSSYDDVLSGIKSEAGLKWSELLEVLALTNEYEEKGIELSSYAVTRFLVDDGDNPGSIVSSLASARENLRSFREKVPSELREVINDTWVEFAISNFEKKLSEHPQIMFNKLTRAMHTCTGITESSMSRNDAWRFITIGRMTERALVTTRLVEVYFARLLNQESNPSVHHWVGLLNTVGAVQEYRKVYQTSVDPMDAIEFILRNKEFARSLIWCVRQAEAHLVAMEDNPLLTSPALHKCQVIKGLCERPLEELLGSNPAVSLNALAKSIEDMAEQIHIDYFPTLK